MEREASLLRCAKLSCYAEFNRMVQAVARSGGELGFQRMPGARPVQGTSAEYFFYTTLVAMLRQVVSNTNPVTQRMELQQVYEWFSLNKPLMSSKTNPRHHKPILSMSSQLSEPLPRPQTAPASLYHPSSSSALPPRRPSTAAAHRRPHTTQQQHSFTSSYMSRSLALDVGQLPGQTTTSVATPSAAQSGRQSGLSRRSGRSGSAAGGRRSSQQSGLPVVDIPASGQQLRAEPQPPVNIATVFQLAPSVAAQMELQREMMSRHRGYGHRPAQHSSSRQLMTTPLTTEDGTKNGAVSGSSGGAVSGSSGGAVSGSSGGAVSGSSGGAAAEMESQEKNVSSPRVADTSTSPGLKQPPPDQPTVSDSRAHQTPTLSVSVTAHSPPTCPHTSPSHKEHPPIHIITLSLSPSTTHHPPPTKRITQSQLRKSGTVAAAGFKCSRYRVRSSSEQKKSTTTFQQDMYI